MLAALATVAAMPLEVPRCQWRGKVAFRDFTSQRGDDGGGGRPAVITGLLSSWQCSRWTLKSLAADARSDIQVTICDANSEEMSSTKVTKRQMALSQYCQELNDLTEKRHASISNSASTVLRGNESQAIGYLKQLELFRYLPHLERDCDFLAVWPWWFRLVARIFGSTTYLWVGPQGSMTGLHNDDEQNLLCQIVGTKRIWLMPNDERHRSFALVNEKYDSGTECADRDLAMSDVAALAAKEGLNIWCCDLHPGEMLYIPRFWFHQVVTTSPVAMSLNNFASGPIGLVRYGALRLLHSIAHDLFGWRRQNCVCHSHHE